MAKWAGKQVIKRANIVIQVGSWLWEYKPYIDAYLDEPRTLEELKSLVDSPATGYDIHHIAEQTPAEKEGYPRSLIDGRD